MGEQGEPWPQNLSAGRLGLALSQQSPPHPQLKALMISNTPYSSSTHQGFTLSHEVSSNVAKNSRT